jgi:hypothetical protein
LLKDDTRSYYAAQSVLTDTGQYGIYYDDLPCDVPGLARAIQGLIVQPQAVRLYNLRRADVEDLGPDGYGVRRVSEMIARIRARDASSLARPRPPARRLGANCRNFAILLVSMLRHQGVPARLRVGFGGYFGGEMAYDHRIAEYWDGARWILADAQIDDVQRRARGIAFDTLDIRPEDPFWLAGDAWRLCRAGERDPNRFGDSDTDRGPAPIRYALLHDFAALAKLELLGCDDWGDLIVKPESTLTGDELALLDRIALLTATVDEELGALPDFFASTSYGQAVLAGLAG